MSIPNFYDIVYKWMLRQIFEGFLGNEKTIIQDAKANELHLTWKFMKQNNIWFAAIIDDVNEFLAVAVEDVGEDVLQYILTKHAYTIVTNFNKPTSPSIHEECMAQFTFAIEDEEGEEEVVFESVESFVNYWFDKSGKLKTIDLEETVTGNAFKLWPELEYNPDEPIYIDKDVADAEGLG